MKLCACGCASVLSKPKYTYSLGHAPKGELRTKWPLCKCGCGNLFVGTPKDNAVDRNAKGRNRNQYSM